GAISAEKGERILIPINMRDGSLLCIGKGNDDWNRSAPHGAGRLMSRAEARHRITLEEYAKAMEGIYTTSVGMNTIDESPMAYKSIHDITRNIRPTCSVEKRLIPIYNFKAGT
ncbi:MAG: RtcB family protein, partial [Clostridia bacterium]|nr:RtcB family protein [Clostridia bacterium]